ncbi:astacin-like metalloprotease toxin 1 [Caerostris darwini]|uniref:Metalloendopeptidase n=1 Tax=Caerostris darwini TaxID=1538125 RepID=A0AAV4SDU3_9ARAC|nr:astacin-like metalloprotease toxin 1 [Caerostris darwini]
MGTLLLLLALVGSSLALPFGQNADPMQNPDLFGGDMLGIDPNDKNVIPGFQLRWTAAVVPYVIDASLEQHRAKILEAMKDYEDKTCVEFKQRTYQKDYIKLFSGKGCYSHVGMMGGQQPQNRSDRDDFLTIYWDNIRPGLEDQFTKLQPHRNILMDTFDYTSVMLYGNTAFSKDNKSNTMVAKTGVRLYETYDKPGLSASDVKRVRKMYWCDEEWMKKEKQRKN